MKYWFVFIVVCTLTVSCKNDIELNTNNFKPVLVMNGIFDTEASENRLYVSLTGIDTSSPVTEGKAEVFVNGELKETVTHSLMDAEKNYYFPLSANFEAGDKVRIKFRTADGSRQAYADTEVPYPVPIDKTEVNLSGTEQNKRVDNLELSVVFTDPPSTENYYRLIVEGETICYYQSEEGMKKKSRRFINWFKFGNEPVLMDGKADSGNADTEEIFPTDPPNIYTVFADKRLDSPYTMKVDVSLYSVYDWRRFNVPNPQYVDYVFLVKLIALTSKAYAYYRALNILEWDDYDPVFMNPVKLPSNVTGGGGIVSIQSASSRNFYSYRQDIRRFSYDFPEEN